MLLRKNVPTNHVYLERVWSKEEKLLIFASTSALGLYYTNCCTTSVMQLDFYLLFKPCRNL